MIEIDESIFEPCKWCNGSGDDGTSVCPDCECTGYVGGLYAVEMFDIYVEQMYKKNIDSSESESKS